MATPLPVTYLVPAGQRCYGGRFPAGGAALAGDAALDGVSAGGALASGASVVSGGGALDGVTVGGVVDSPVPSAPSASYTARSTAAGVVWAHRPTLDTEVTAHLTTAAAERTVIAPRRVVDSDGLPWIEQIVLGGTLAAPYTAGAVTMLLVEALHWPDPAVTGSFYFMAFDLTAGSPSKNLFLCTARSGLLLTVTYVPQTLDPFTATQMSYPAGAVVGNEEMRQWIRVFSALPAGENGMAVDDRADGGAVPLRSRSAGGTYGVPRDLDIWQYGYYGHPDNQALWENWTPWQGTTVKTARGPVNGAAAKYRLWDGAEFFMQFRIKIDPRFFGLHPANQGQWGRKTWAIINEISTYNELVAGMAPGNNFSIPSTPESPFGLATAKASQTIGMNDKVRSQPSVQPNSPWFVPPYYANTAYSGGPLPSTGCATPDGSAAWEVPDDETVYFYIRCKPGHSGVADTELEVKFARPFAPGYDGTYTTLINLTDVLLTFSGAGDYPYPAGSFSYPGVTTMNALPGFQAFWLFGYLNIWQSWGISPPKASYYYRIGDVIFSRQAIAPPQIDLPDWVPPPGEITTLTQSNGRLSNRFRDVVAPGFQAFYSKSIVNAYPGAVRNNNLGQFGSTMWFGSGHATGSNDNSVMLLEYGQTAATFRRLIDPTNWAAAGGVNDGGDPSIASLVAYPWMESTTDGKPLSPHAWQTQVLQDPEDGGAAYGTFWQTFGAAVGHAGYNATGAHKLPITSATANASSWVRAKPVSTYPANTSVWGAPLLAAPAYAQGRMYMLPNSNVPLRWFDLTTGVDGVGSNTPDYVNHDGNPRGNGRLIPVPERGMIVLLYKKTGVLKAQYWYTSEADPIIRTATIGTALALNTSWSTAAWCPISARFIIAGVTGDTTAFHELAIPADPTTTWPVERAPFGAGQSFTFVEPSSNADAYGKFDWDPKLRSVTFMPTAQHDGVTDEVVYVYRPRST